MAANPRAGQPAQPEDLIDVAHVVTAYYTVQPDPDDVAQQVAFGTSGHRGSSLDGAFNEAHILATTQAIAEYRAAQGTTGPLFIGRDTHALSEPAWVSALEVLAANDVAVMVDSADRYTPTPAISHAILMYNRGRSNDLADGIVVTPSHNPPRDGGFKYNPPNGGPADTDATGAIAKRANEILRDGLKAAKRVPLARALTSAQRHDYMSAYVDDLPNVVDVHAIRAQGVRIGADPLGGASVDYWGAIGERHNLELTVVNPLVDATWRFMTLDTDGKIRMDCSSPNAMASLINNRDKYQIATGNDADSDRHGIVTPDGWAAQPESLSRGGDRLPVQPPAVVAVVDRGGQDGGEQLDHRPGGRRPGPQADRGSGRVQVVRRRIAQRQHRFRWRGECGRVVPAHRRVGVDH